MGIFFSRFLLAVPLLTLLACSTNDSGSADPVEAARNQNEKRIDTADVTEKQETDANFLVNAAGNTLLQMELGKLAQQQSSTAVVRAYGPRLVQQRLEMLRALQSVAASKQLTIPADLGDDARAAYHEVSKLAGAPFDKKLMELVVKTQKQDEDAFDDMKEEAYDGDIRGFAAKYLPAVQEQLAAAKEVEDEVADLP